MNNKIHNLSQGERQPILENLALMTREKGEILFAYGYGSFVEGMPFHDIDVGVYLSNIEEESATQYALDLAGQLEKRVGLPVDVRVLNFAPLSFLYHVFRGKVLSEKDEDRRVELVERTVRRYLDMKPIVRMAIREAFAA